MKKIYIAGKVTGLPFEEVKKKFAEAQESLEAIGHEAVNPITLVNDANCEWEVAMKICLKAMLDCDAIMLLDDWEDSTGAKIEMKLADSVGIDISYAGEGIFYKRFLLCH
jgi:hypothetical protein